MVIFMEMTAGSSSQTLVLLPVSIFFDLSFDKLRMTIKKGFSLPSGLRIKGCASNLGCKVKEHWGEIVAKNHKRCYINPTNGGAEIAMKCWHCFSIIVDFSNNIKYELLYGVLCVLVFNKTNYLIIDFNSLRYCKALLPVNSLKSLLKWLKLWKPLS